ncbi:cytokine receptor-like factor 3 [Clytia hemisphaerica]|uniref:Fibronectin type-III domain-containing protein n=1 Tax=Clytia hemisphaerica TaxID=252671 RepID=A0A7M5X392_9CNID|eukprot:TCONS_00004371-protein
MNVEDTLERCENRLSFLSNKLSEYGKTQQYIKESADSTKKALQGHLMHAKETILRNLDHQYERLCTSVDETVKKDIENLFDLEEHLKKEIENLKNILASVKADEKQLNLQQINQKVTEIGKSQPELPVVSLSFSTKINEAALHSIEDKTRDLLKLNMTGSVQIMETLERPGAIIVRWDEQPMSDSESVATDTSTITEYILQATTKNDGVFYTIYEGENLEYTMTLAEPSKTYKFRVCQYMNTTNGGAVCGAWSVIKTAATMLSPHVWCEGDCRTDSDLQLYQLSNGGRTATKVFPESSRILRSKEPSCQSGQQITFWVDETGESSSNDGIGLICGTQTNKQFTASPNTTVLNTKGIIYVNGTRMTTKLPSLKKNSIIVIQASKLAHTLNSGAKKYRVSISVDDKEVTFDWSASTTSAANEIDALFFGCVFEHTGWQLSVG